MPQISIVIPHLGNAELLEQTLVSVLENRPNDCQIVVPHSGYADPYDLNDEVCFLEVPRRASVVKCAELALPECDSEVIHLLKSGTEVSDGWCDWPVSHFQDPYVGCVSPLIVDECDEIISAGIASDFLLRERQLGHRQNEQRLRKLDPLAPTATGGFYRKSALQQISGFGNFGATTFALEIGLALEMIGFESKLETDSRIRIDADLFGSKPTFGLGQQLQRLVWRFASADSIGKSISVTSIALLLELSTAIINPVKLLQIAGRLTAMLEAGRYGKFRQQLEKATGPQLADSKILKIEQRSPTNRKAA